MHNWPTRIFGKRGATRSPERLVKSEGITTSERKFRRCHAIPGFSVTRVDFFSRSPFAEDCRTTRVFLEKGIGTCGNDIGKRPEFKRFCASEPTICARPKY